MCSPVHNKFKNHCFISVLRLVCKLKMFVYVVILKEFMTIFLLMIMLLNHINMLWGKNCTLVDAQMQWAKNHLHMPMHSKVMMDNVSTCRIFSWCLLYKLIYLYILIFTTISPILHNLWNWNFASPFFCPCQQQRHQKNEFW